MLKSLMLVFSFSLSSCACNDSIANSDKVIPTSQDITESSQIHNMPLYQSMDWVGEGSFTHGIEGPAVDRQGNLYAVNYLRSGTIGRVSGNAQAEIFAELPNNSVGNGIRFDQHGNMYIADYVNHNILIIHATELVQPLANTIEVYAHSSRMNQPNDIAITTDGVIFASDPNWSRGDGNLWRVGKDRQVTLLESGMGTTNGIAVSSDGKWLYVNESVQRNIWRYQLDDRGNVSNKQLLINFPDYGLDGMRTDKNGNLFIARYGKGVVAIVSPEGLVLKEVALKGQYPTNVAFGGADGKQVFVTMQKRGAIESFFIE